MPGRDGCRKSRPNPPGAKRNRPSKTSGNSENQEGSSPGGPAGLASPSQVTSLIFRSNATYRGVWSELHSPVNTIPRRKPAQKNSRSVSHSDLHRPLVAAVQPPAAGAGPCERHVAFTVMPCVFVAAPAANRDLLVRLSQQAARQAGTLLTLTRAVYTRQGSYATGRGIHYLIDTCSLYGIIRIAEGA